MTNDQQSAAAPVELDGAALAAVAGASGARIDPNG
jgi:hypothetical protein